MLHDDAGIENHERIITEGNLPEAIHAQEKALKSEGAVLPSPRVEVQEPAYSMHMAYAIISCLFMQMGPCLHDFKNPSLLVLLSRGRSWFCANTAEYE